MSSEVILTFVSDAMSDNTFDVLSFKGQESISKPYEFDFVLRSKVKNIDCSSVLNSDICFSIEQNGYTRYIRGILRTFEMLEKKNEYVIYKAELVPSIWKASLYHCNEVYLNMTVPQIIEAVLVKVGFSSLDYRFDLGRTYREWNFKCQYDENCLDYISHLMEREGIYYFFECSELDEILVMTDNLSFQSDIDDSAINFSEHSGMDNLMQNNIVYDINQCFKRVPKKVVLRDYNDDTPSVEIKGTATVDANGIGDVNFFGQNITDVAEGEALAAIRAEALLANSKTSSAKSTVSRFSAGRQFILSEHPINDFNQSYLITFCRHEGYDARYFEPSKDGRIGRCYRNNIHLIHSELQYRPLLDTYRSKINGVFHAQIDAEGDGTYAEIDDEGRYKVILPFDTEERSDGMASWWVRMSQSLGGAQEGFHFPLRKGARVLISFIDGDPDRPIIIGAVPNAEQPSIVKGDTQTTGKLKTAGGNRFEFEDKNGCERITLESPYNSSYMHLGSPDRDGDGITMMTQGLYKEEYIGGMVSTTVTKNRRGTLNNNSKDQYDERTALHTFKKMVTSSTEGTVGHLASELTEAEELSGNYIVERRNGERFTWSDGDDYSIGNGKVFALGSAYTLNIIKDPTATDFNDFVTKMTNVGAAARCTSDSLSGWFGLQLSASSTAQEKVLGHTYNFTSGKTLQKYNGSFQEFFEAANTSVFWGVANEWHFGAASEYFLGLKNEINIGGLWEANLTVKVETSITRTQIDLQKNYLSTQANKVAASNFNADLQNSEVNGSKLTAQLSKIESNASAIETNASAIESNATKIKSQASAIESNATEIKNALTEIKNNATKIDSAMSEIRSNATAINNVSAKVETTSADVEFLVFKSYL